MQGAVTIVLPTHALIKKENSGRYKVYLLKVHVIVFDPNFSLVEKEGFPTPSSE